MTESATLREETPEDHSAIRRLLIAAFDRYGEAELVEALRKEGDLVFGGVATVDGVIVGYAALSRMNAPFPALGLGPVAVAAAYRGKGIANALLRWSLARARGKTSGVRFLCWATAPFTAVSDFDWNLQPASTRHMRGRISWRWRLTARFQPRKDQ